MLVNSGEHKHLVQLLGLLVAGEKLAHEFSRQQSMCFPDRGDRQFFKQQSRHELFHAKVFDAGIRYLNVRGPGLAFKNDAMVRYGRLLREDMEQSNYAETVMGMQVILEGFGDIILNRLNDGIEKRSHSFSRVRKLIIGQEDAHHAYGLRKLETLTGGDPALRERLGIRSQDYLELINLFLGSAADIFCHLNIDPQAYTNEFNHCLPSWLEFRRT